MPLPLFSAAGPNTRRRRRNQLLLWIGTAAVSLILYAVVSGWASDRGISVPVQQATIVLIVLALAGLTALHWRELDEVGRKANAMAFFWSGMLTWTLFLLAIGILAPGGGLKATLFPAYGSAFLVIGLHAVLYFVFYAALWLRNRLP